MSHNLLTKRTLLNIDDFTKNVTELFNANGDIVNHYDYRPYGAILWSKESIPNPIQYSSEVYDPELGLISYNYRHYNPQDGRWLTRDPIQEQGGLNLYGFVGNNSLLRVDLLGLFAWLDCTRYKQGENAFVQECSLWIVDSCECPECEEHNTAMSNAKNARDLRKAARAVQDCIKQNAPDKSYALIITPIYTNYGENRKINDKGRDGPLPLRTYRILPKIGKSLRDQEQKGGISYHTGSPSVTDLNLTHPGNVKEGGIVRSGLQIHGMGLSRGCITIGTCVQDPFMFTSYFNDPNEYLYLTTTSGAEDEKGLIERIMDGHKNCGGTYLSIKESENLPPEGLLKEQSAYDAASGGSYIISPPKIKITFL